MPQIATTPPPLPDAIRWTWDFGIGLGDADSAALTALLKALRDDGRLAEAARAAGISYRTAWGLLRQCEDGFGRPLVVKERGRGTRLSEFGEQLVRLDSEARTGLREAHQPWNRRLHALLSAAGDSAPARLPLAASHDLALGDWIENGRHVQVDVFWRGSEEALAALARGEFDIAGFHLPAAWLPAQRLAWLSRWLKNRQFQIFPIMLREHGLLTAAGNPLAVNSLADVARLGLRMVNRQRGSGTRNMIDELIAANGLQPQDIPGYAHEEFTHHAVAAAIATGQADVGFGIRAVAARYDLGFVPLGWDHYCLALRSGIANSPAVTQLLRRFQGETFLKRVTALTGYVIDPEQQHLMSLEQFVDSPVPQP